MEYELLILGHDQPLDAVNDNVDVEVRLGVRTASTCGRRT